MVTWFSTFWAWNWRSALRRSPRRKIRPMEPLRKNVVGPGMVFLPALPQKPGSGESRGIEEHPFGSDRGTGGIRPDRVAHCEPADLRTAATHRGGERVARMHADVAAERPVLDEPALPAVDEGAAGAAHPGAVL